jgi:ribosomal protein L21E
MNKFITLTKACNKVRIDINPMLISEMLDMGINGNAGTEVGMMSGTKIDVVQTIDEIHQLIKKSQYITL